MRLTGQLKTAVHTTMKDNSINTMDESIMMASPNPPSVPQSILEEALEATRKSRQQAYAHPILNFARIADLWVSLLRMWGVMTPDSKPLTPEHVAQMMVAFKIAREANTHKRDNIVDEAGYTDCVDRIHEALIANGYLGGLEDMRQMDFNQLRELYDKLEAIGSDALIYEGK